MSERYETFTPLNPASFMYRRYAGPRSDLTLAHETGGQMYNNGYGVMGHPISLLSRTLVSGAQYLNAYTTDVGNASIARYLPFFHGQAGRPITTSFFNRLGGFTLRNYQPQTNAFADVEYRNLWMGLRQFQSSDQAYFDGAVPTFPPPYAMAEYTEVDGEPCAATAGDDHMLLFDVFDVYQAEGMYGVTASVEYYDDHGAFAVLVTDGDDGWREAIRVEKQGTGEWRTASFQDSRWCSSTRDHGEMHYDDLAVRDEGSTGGRTYIRWAELQFVLATDWARRSVASVAPVSPPRGPALSAEWTEVRVPLPEEPVFAASIPVFADSYGHQLVEAEAWIEASDGRRLLARRDYYMPAREIEPIELPLVPTEGEALVLRLRCADGGVRWAAGPGDALGHQLLTYEMDPVETDAQVAGEIDALTPFAGIVAPEGSATVQLQRHLPGTGWSEPIPTVTCRVDGQRALVCEPQTAGRYRLVGGDGTATALLQLRRAQPAHPATPVDPGRAAIEWGQDNPWQPREHLRPTQPGTYRLAGQSPSLEPPAAFHHTPSESDRIVIALRNGTPSSLMRLYWAGPGRDLGPSRSVYIPVVANDTQLRQYIFHLGCDPSWTDASEITQLRLEPVIGATERGEIEVGPITLTRGGSAP
jgi:hypothetical protein